MCSGNPCVLLLFLLSFGNLYAQNLDSLKNLLKEHKEDTLAVILNNKLAWAYRGMNPDSAYLFSDNALLLSEKIKWERGVAQSSYQLGVLSIMKGDYSRALDYYSTAKLIYEKLNDSEGLARILGNIGIVYHIQSDYAKALDYYLKALKIAEERKDKDGIAQHTGNIGIVYFNQANYPKALEYYFKALALANEQKNSDAIAVNLGNIGLVYSKQRNYTQALDYYFKALKRDNEAGEKGRITGWMGNIGIVYRGQGDSALAKGNGLYAEERYSKALEYYFRALKISEEIGDKSGISIRLADIGVLYSKQNKHEAALEYLEKALKIAVEIGAKDLERELEDGLYITYKAKATLAGISPQKKAEYTLKALEHHEKAILLKDSIFAKEKQNELVRKEMNYAFEKKEAATKAEQEKKDAVAASEAQRQKLVLALVSCVLILVFMFSGFIFRSLRITRRQKLAIEAKNKETEEQKKLIEEKNKDILDSIRYAKRIQSSLLPTEKYIDRILNRK